MLFFAPNKYSYSCSYYYTRQRNYVAGFVIVTLQFGGTDSQIQLSLTRDNPYYGFDTKTRELTVIQRIHLVKKDDKFQRLEISCVIGYDSVCPQRAIVSL